jgi:hypothetical protein
VRYTLNNTVRKLDIGIVMCAMSCLWPPIEQRLLSLTCCMLEKIVGLSFTRQVAPKSKYHDDNKGGGNSIRLNSIKQIAKTSIILKLNLFFH